MVLPWWRGIQLSDNTAFFRLFQTIETIGRERPDHDFVSRRGLGYSVCTRRPSSIACHTRSLVAGMSMWRTR